MTPHPALSARQLDVLRARCETGSRKEAGRRLEIGVWQVGNILRTIACCDDDAGACWAHRVELEATSTPVR